MPASQDDSTTANTQTILIQICGKKLQMHKNTLEIGRPNVRYSVGETVQFFGSLYECNQYHLSNAGNPPGDNGSGRYYWDIVLETPNRRHESIW